jgi:ABC-type polar amino acid transport system ATPase subunit
VEERPKVIAERRRNIGLKRTHEMGFAHSAADRLIMFDQGRILEERDA